MRPSLSTGPTDAELDAIVDPFQRIVLINRFAGIWGTLPPRLHRRRIKDFAHIWSMRDPETGERLYTLSKIAIRVGLSRSRVFHLTRPSASLRLKETSVSHLNEQAA